MNLARSSQPPKPPPKKKQIIKTTWEWMQPNTKARCLDEYHDVRTGVDAQDSHLVNS